MSIKYAEVTIIKNLEKESINDYVGRFFGREISVTDDDTIIIQFDDGSIMDTSNLEEKEDIYSDYEDEKSFESKTDIISYTNSNIESKYSDTDTEINSFSVNNKLNNRIVLLNIIYMPNKFLESFIVNNILFQMNIPDSNYSTFGNKYSISYRNLFITSKNKDKYKNSNERNSSFKTVETEPSIYNMVYSCMSTRESTQRIDSFGIARIRSSNLSPRFALAYKDNYFKKQDIIYLVDRIFKFKF